MNQAQHMLYHGTILLLQEAVTETEWSIEDLKAEIREALEDGGDVYFAEQALAFEEDNLLDLKADLAEAESQFDEFDD